MDKKVWQRAVADLNPPGVPNSFRRAHRQQNIASILLKRELGAGARRSVHMLGEDRSENFWAERESAAKVCGDAVMRWLRRMKDADLSSVFAIGYEHSTKVGISSCPLRPSRRFRLPLALTGTCRSCRRIL